MMCSLFVLFFFRNAAILKMAHITKYFPYKWMIDFSFIKVTYTMLCIYIKKVKYTCIQPFRTYKWLLNEYIV